MSTSVQEEMQKAMCSDEILLHWAQQELSWNLLKEHATLVGSDRPPRRMHTASCTIITEASSEIVSHD